MRGFHVMTADDPELQLILDSFGRDTSCGSHLTFVEASGNRGVDTAAIAKALREALPPPGAKWPS
jgi:hypothetical protein